MIGVVADGDASVVEVGVRAPWEVSPSRSWRSASISHSCCWRRLSFSSIVGCRAVSAANRPPAAISGSCFASPTSTTLAPVRSTSSRRRARSRVPAVPASSIDQHRAAVEAAGLAAVDGDQQPGDRGRRDAGGHRQLVGGDAGVGGADHPVAGALPNVAGGGEGERLAGASRCGERRRRRCRTGSSGSPPGPVRPTGSTASRRARPSARRSPHTARSAPSSERAVSSARRSMSSSSNVVQRSCGRQGGDRPARRVADHGARARDDAVQRRDLAAVDEVLGEVLDPFDRCAGRKRVAPRLEDVAAVERRVVRGQPVGAEQPVLDGAVAQRR